MRNLWLALILGWLFFLGSCTGQRAAELKSSITLRPPLKGSCQSIVFQGRILTKQNTLDVFECSGWSRQFPRLTMAIQSMDEDKVNNVFMPINETLLSDSHKQSLLFQITARAESRGQMDDIANILEKSFSQQKILGQIDRLLDSDSLKDSDRSILMKLLSDDNAVNLKMLRAMTSIVKAFEVHKDGIFTAIKPDSSDRFVQRVVTVLDDLTSRVDNRDWLYFSRVIYDQQYGSAVKLWAQEGVDAPLAPLLGIIKQPRFTFDIRYLQKSLAQGIVCNNEGNQRKFAINVASELNHTVDSFKRDSQDLFEKHLLHALTKFLGFQEFCGESKSPQGLVSFFNVLNHTFNMIPSTHDYKFLRTVHHILGDNRFGLLALLTSKSFAEYRDLMLTIQAGQWDEEFVRINYKMLMLIPQDDLISMSELLADFAGSNNPSSRWFKSWSKSWQSLTYDEKAQLVEFLGLLLQPDQKLSSLLEVTYEVFNNFPAFSPAMASHLGQADYQNNLRYLLNNLINDDVQEEVSQFMSEKGLFEFIKIITWATSEEYRRRPDLKKTHELEASLIIRPSPELTEYKNRTCFEHLSKRYQQNVNYYHIVNSLPEDCLAILGQVGFIGQTYIWMHQGHHFFADKHGIDDFHTNMGVWAPGMLHFMFSAAVKANQVILAADGKTGLMLNIDAIHRAATRPEILEAFHLFSNLYVMVAQKIKFESRFQNYVEKKSNVELNSITSDIFDLLLKQPSRLQVHAKTSSCKEISARMGANPCLSTDETKERVISLLRILKKKNQTTSLLQELVKWVHPQGGLPIDSSKGKVRHATNLDEIIRFLYDLSSPKTSQDFYYITEDDSYLLPGTTLERLEIVLREIGFTNNFYGAHFKNDISTSQNYRSAVISNEKLLAWLDRASPLMRRLGFLPLDSKWRLKNVRNTYWSLVEVSDEYLQADGSKISYDNFIQSLLVAVVNSSPEHTQNFSPYRIPRAETTEGHNGIFLTKITEMSGLRHMSQFARARFGNLQVLDSTEFKQIDSQLIARHDLKLLQKTIQRQFDLYLDQDRNQINLLIEDLFKYLNGLSIHEQKLWEELIVKSMLLLSDHRLSTANIQQIAVLAEIFIKLWPEMKSLLMSIEQPADFLTFLNQQMDSWLVKPKSLDKVLGFILASKTFNTREIESLLLDADTRQMLGRFLNQLAKIPEDNSLNWHETLRFLLAHPDNKWNPVIDWLDIAMDQRPDKKLSLSLMLSYLGQKQQNEYRLQWILDEVLLQRRPQLLQFLQETFPSLQFK